MVRTLFRMKQMNKGTRGAILITGAQRGAPRQCDKKCFINPRSRINRRRNKEITEQRVTNVLTDVCNLPNSHPISCLFKTNCSDELCIILSGHYRIIVAYKPVGLNAA